MSRSTSDPNLGHDENNVDNSTIPDYNAPPPYAANSSTSQAVKFSSDIMILKLSNILINLFL